MADTGAWGTECVNCNRESHFLGIYCWWGIWAGLALLLIVGVCVALGLVFA